MPDYAAQFEAAGHTLTERWWEHVDIPGYPNNVTAAGFNALEDQSTLDYLGVVYADVLVVLNTERSEGKAVETGIAIALLKPIILVGSRTNIFHFIPSVYPVRDVRAAIRKLAS